MTAVKIKTTLQVRVSDSLNDCMVRIYCNGELALHTVIFSSHQMIDNKFDYDIMLSIDMEEGKDYNFAYFYSHTDKIEINFKRLAINDKIVIPIFPLNYVAHSNLYDPEAPTYKNIFYDIDPTLYENHVNARFLGFDTPISANVGKTMTLRLKDGEVQATGYFKQPDKFKRIQNLVDKKAGNTQPINGYSSNFHWIIDYYNHIIEKGKFMHTNKKLESIYSIWLKFTSIKDVYQWRKQNAQEIDAQFDIFLKQLEDKVDALALTKTVDIKWVTQTEHDIDDLKKLIEKNPSNEFAMNQLKKMQDSLSNLQDSMSDVYSSEHYPSVLLFDTNKNHTERMSIVTLKEEFDLLRQYGFDKVMQDWNRKGYVIYRLWDRGIFGHYKMACPSCLAYWQDPSFENEKEMSQRVVEILSRETAEYKIFCNMVKEMHLRFMFIAEK